MIYFGLDKLVQQVLKKAVDYNAANKKKNNSFIVSISQVHSVPLGGVTALLEVLMKAALAIKLNRPGHLFSLTVRISLGFTEMEDGVEQSLYETHSGMNSATSLSKGLPFSL